HVDRAVGCHHDAGSGARHFQGAVNQGHSIFAAETQVSEKHIDLLAFEDVYCARDIRSYVHIVIVLKQTSQPVASVLFIINNEDGGLEVHWSMLDTRC